MTPIGALSFSVVLLTRGVGWAQVVGAVIVTVAVVAGVGGAFGAITRGRAVAAIVVYAAVGGLLTVLTKLLADRGVGLPDIYVSRTLLAGIAWTALVPPRDLPASSVPRLAVRSALQTGYFVLLIAAVQRGTPTVVQTIVAATPLILLGGTAVVRRERPSVRLLGAAVAVVAGIGLAVS
jgi:drug/metabolite transporter (DMT)-like permease